MPVKEPPYDVGDQIVLFVDLVNAADAPANPVDLKLQIGRKDGTVLQTIDESAMTNPSVGRFEYAYIIPEPELEFAWDATGGGVTIVRTGSIPTRRRTLPRP